MSWVDELLSGDDVLVLDGGMGTQLFDAGLTSGDSPELWNVEHPDRVTAIHRGYVDAGSDIILTNSFGGTRFRLKLHQLDGRVFELNKAAAANARAAADAAERTVLVAGSMGPTGELLAPMGDMTPEAAAEAFAEQAAGLTAGGADLLWIETMSDLGEITAAINGARSASDLPIAATMSFDTAGKTMMGVSGADAATHLSDLDLIAFGANCGNNLPDTMQALRDIHDTGSNGSLTIVKANAGIPVWQGDTLSYDATPEVMAAFAHQMKELGVRLIGACCGSNPEHIRAMRDVLDGVAAPPDVTFATAARAADQPASAGARGGRRRRRTRT